MRKTWGGSEVDIELVEAVNGRETVEAVRLKVLVYRSARGQLFKPSDTGALGKEIQPLPRWLILGKLNAEEILLTLWFW
jgi:hypothetical protein